MVCDGIFLSWVCYGDPHHPPSMGRENIGQLLSIRGLGVHILKHVHLFPFWALLLITLTTWIQTWFVQPTAAHASFAKVVRSILGSARREKSCQWLLKCELTRQLNRKWVCSVFIFFWCKNSTSRAQISGGTSSQYIVSFVKASFSRNVWIWHVGFISRQDQFRIPQWCRLTFYSLNIGDHMRLIQALWSGCPMAAILNPMRCPSASWIHNIAPIQCSWRLGTGHVRCQRGVRITLWTPRNMIYLKGECTFEPFNPLLQSQIWGLWKL